MTSSGVASDYELVLRSILSMSRFRIDYACRLIGLWFGPSPIVNEPVGLFERKIETSESVKRSHRRGHK